MPIFMGDKKKVASLITRMRSGSENYDDMREHNEEMKQVATNDDGDELDQDHGYKAAAEAIINAMNARDPERLSHALMTFFDMAKMRDSE